MSRRRKNSPIGGMVEIASRLPWWAAVALALVSYLMLHRFALQRGTAVAPGQLGTIANQTLWRALATVGQYVVPAIFMAGAAVSAWQQRQRRQMVTNVAEARSADVLNGMSWRQFEQLVGEGFRLQGFRVTETGGGGADGGVDLELTKGTEKFLVQCKQWRALKVGVEVVRELYGVMAARGAAGGFVVTSGRFTQDAVAFAKGRNLELIDGPRLRILLQAERIRSTRPPASSVAPAGFAEGQVEAATTPLVPPSCPVCAKAMVRRAAKRGSHAGSEFWGCSGYPACRGTRPIV